MKKTTILFIWLLCALSFSLSATEEPCEELASETTPCCLSQPLVEVKTGYFFFSDSKMRKIYDRGGWDVQLCASYPIWSLTGPWSLHAYGAVEYFQRSGKSMHGHQKTSLWSIPVNIGLKPVYTIDADRHYYFSIGPRYFYLHQHNDSSYVYKTLSRNGLGIFVNTGFHYTLCDCLVIDLFGEYSYAKMHVHRSRDNIYTRNVQVGGFTLGAGLGYAF